MTMSIQREMSEKIAADMATIGFDLFKGIVYQIAPDYDVTNGDLLEGEARFPFVSLSSVQAEEFPLGVSTNVTAKVSRKISVALIADKIMVIQNPDPYAKYRQDALRVINVNRFRGELDSDPNACVLQATVRPGSPIAQGPWQSYSKYVSLFDVIFETYETNYIT